MRNVLTDSRLVELKILPVSTDTSRPQRLEEINHQDYHFISKQEFESEIMNNNFVEYGIFEKHYFGTTMEAIRRVVNSGKICILNLYPQV